MYVIMKKKKKKVSLASREKLCGDRNMGIIIQSVITMKTHLQLHNLHKILPAPLVRCTNTQLYYHLPPVSLGLYSNYHHRAAH